MKPIQAFLVFTLTLTVFVGAGMALGTTSYGSAPAIDGYGNAAPVANLSSLSVPVPATRPYAVDIAALD